MIKASNTTRPCVDINVHENSAWYALQSESLIVYSTLEKKHAAKFLGLDISDHEQVVRALSELPSPFAVVVEREELVLAAVDRFRSVPLFYSINREQFSLSDNVNDTLLSSAASKPDFNSIGHFLLCGHTLKDTTLFSSIFALRPGQYGLYDKEQKSLVTDYFHRYSEKPDNASRSSPNQSDISNCYREALANLLQSASGKPLVIPLRGYEEDIFLLTLLSETGYSNLIAVEYAPAPAKRRTGHKRIAKSLGVPLLHATLSRRQIRKAFRQKKRRDYARFSCNHSHLPNYRSYFNLASLVERDLIPQDSVIVDGAASPFCCAFASYRQIRPSDSSKSIDEHLWSSFFNLFPEFSREMAALKGSTWIKQLFDVEDGESELLKMTESWLRHERLPKVLINEKSVYQFLGLEFNFPFLNSNLLDCRDRYPTTQDAGRGFELELERIFRSLSLLGIHSSMHLDPAATGSVSVKLSNNKLGRYWDKISYFLPQNKLLSPYQYRYFLLNYQNCCAQWESAFAARHLLDELDILGYPQEHLPAVVHK